MSISREEVKHIAYLSRLDLKENEVDKYTGHISQLLDYVETLKGVNVDQVEPMSHAIPVYNIMRDDVVGESLPVELALANAPEKDGPYFKVPRVTE